MQQIGFLEFWEYMWREPAISGAFLSGRVKLNATSILHRSDHREVLSCVVAGALARGYSDVLKENLAGEVARGQHNLLSCRFLPRQRLPERWLLRCLCRCR